MPKTSTGTPLTGAICDGANQGCVHATAAATWLHVIGGLIFAYGSAHQHCYHRILAGLRTRARRMRPGYD
eukprot:1185614-Prorocentrum_minimum.AAC.2